MAMNRADLHIHTTASDGLHAPADIVRMAKEAGLAAIAVTDHDTMAGTEEAVEAGRRFGVEVVPGVEISTSAEGIDVHVLAYYPDWRNDEWLSRLAGLRDTRADRNARMIAKLRGLGIPITLEEVERKAGKLDDPEKPVGRPHMAEVLVDKGIVGSVREAFDRYLAAGAAAYVNPPRIHPFEAVDWIREAGGTSVLAHPGLYGNDALVEEIVKYGVRGIEVFHSDHGEDEENRYAALAERYGLIFTGGSDFHGERESGAFHGPIGGRTVDAAVLRKLNPAARGG
ncbi:phosphatase [Paenibacillus cisolokensis]|uniref:Phosphatase n=1 Tax=Paenibacillus cisolokensis TaxID=1658519 RepID=A0ABQ4N4G2_9BACL|nr:PHP domain-containing protein [Paenibacillus cisolokensis]GIQ63098.1 phosphatase [Paenibacillus cisolokensis]